LTVDLVAEREAGGIEHLKNAVLDEDWYGHEWITNDSVVSWDTSICMRVGKSLVTAELDKHLKMNSVQF
jgi:hypothetical protein